MEDRAFIVFSVGPVQTFISAARSLRDLWTGSFLLAWLTRQAMEPIIERHGIAAFIEPDMSRDPMSVHELKKNLRSPCLPNRFLAEVPAEGAEDLAESCKRKFHEAWREIAQRVREELTAEIESKFLSNDSTSDGEEFVEPWKDSVERLWWDQVESFFDARVVCVPWRDCPPKVLESLLGKPKDDPNWKNAKAVDVLWSDRADLATRVLAADKAIRKVTTYRPRLDDLGRIPAKCSLLGSYEHLGPAELGEAAEFWQELAENISLEGTKVRSGERLCAVSLVKRFAWPAYFSKELQLDTRKMYLPDTPTVAAAEWLKTDPILDPETVRKTKEVWSGQWLHWTRPDQDRDEEKCPEEVWEQLEEKRKKQGRAPTYYAVLVMDGDRMGRHLRARPGPEHPRAISRALATFALNYVENIVKEHFGTLIYCGGDDVLALLPTSQAITCAKAIREAFRQVWSREVAKTGYIVEATLSAGIAVVHFKEDLRFALETARQTERQAKNSGRDILAVTICRRSGEHTTTLCPWDFVDTVTRWVKGFSGSTVREAGASDRWARHLYQELPVLKGLTSEAVKAEMRRQVDRLEESSRKLLWPTDPKHAGRQLVEEFTDYCNKMNKRGLPEETLPESFLTLCQTAAFLARRRDE